MASIILPLHGKGDISVHRQLMVDASRGRGFRPDFMERTMIQLGAALPSFFKKDLSERQKLKARQREKFLAGVAKHGV